MIWCVCVCVHMYIYIYKFIYSVLTWLVQSGLHGSADKPEVQGLHNKLILDVSLHFTSDAASLHETLWPPVAFARQKQLRCHMAIAVPGTKLQLFLLHRARNHSNHLQYSNLEQHRECSPHMRKIEWSVAGNPAPASKRCPEQSGDGHPNTIQGLRHLRRLPQNQA